MRSQLCHLIRRTRVSGCCIRLERPNSIKPPRCTPQRSPRTHSSTATPTHHSAVSLRVRLESDAARVKLSCSKLLLHLLRPSSSSLLLQAQPHTRMQRRPPTRCPLPLLPLYRQAPQRQPLMRARSQSLCSCPPQPHRPMQRQPPRRARRACSASLPLIRPVTVTPPPPRCARRAPA